MSVVVLDNVADDYDCASVGDFVLSRVVAQWGAANINNWKHDAHLASYGPLPGFLGALGIDTPNGQCHHLLLPQGKHVDRHSHSDWPAFVFFPEHHASPLIAQVGHGADGCQIIHTEPGRLVYIPAGVEHWVLRNMSENYRLSLAAEISNDWRP